jgi:cell division protein ZapD
MTQTLYEFPLNEKVRTYLRIEQLLSEFQQNHSDACPVNQATLFETLFSLIELFDRNDVRIDLIKDLDKHESKLVKWSQHPKINNAALQDMLQQVVRLSEQLQSSARIGGRLKEHKFLASIRSRYSMIGGNCCFDLPQLHYWLNQPECFRQRDLEQWLAELKLVSEAIALNLKMLREKADFVELEAINGVLTESAEGIDLLRVRCANDGRYYPTVSGNKYRFTLRFISFDSSSETANIQLQLACC